jgi:ATP-dependent helicase/nuclease subunit A
MGWTDAQREAIETRGQRVIVSAGAGSGKTRVLVERFLRLLEENPSWRVADIAAVTFTEKAAREMVSRIRREIRSRIAQAESAEARERWRAHRNALDSARIGTIHSLCAAILRAHPAEAGIDPAFSVLEELEAETLLEQAIEETLDAADRPFSRAALSSMSQTESGDAASAAPSTLPRPPALGPRPLRLVEVFAHLSSHEVKAALASFIRQGAAAAEAMARVDGKTPAELFEYWQQALRRAREEAARATLDSDAWLEDARTIKRLAGDPSDRREQLRAQVAGLLDQIAAAQDEPVGGSPGDRIARLLIEIKSTINLTGGSKKKWPSEADFLAVKEALARMREAIRQAAPLALELNEADRAAAEVVARLAELYRQARRRFSALKRARSALDFNDLEELTAGVLTRHEAVCKRYYDSRRGLIRALMVDEFQDTAPIQALILRKLAPRSGEFFIIGDAKQSIYRFRGADVTVFHAMRDELTTTGGRDVPMSACFRTHDRLIAFVNHLFPAVFTRESRYDTPYEAMTAHRRPARDAESVELHIVTQDKDAGTKLRAGQLREREAGLVARRIREIVGREEIAVCGKDDEARAAQYGDFALLFQASTGFDAFEQALADANVPYVTIAGRGFYDRQEITDLTNLLAFLVSPNDNLRLAAALRSPMFALSDETLLRLRTPPVRRTLWRALCDEAVPHAEAERDAVEAARHVLARLRARAGRTSAAELAVEALTETGYLATLMALPHGERRVANVEKFIEQARGLASMTLAELVERVGQMQFREAREGEATVEESGAVRLMTVHKSKGLEFPIVWLVDTTYKGKSSRDLVAANVDYGVAVRVGADHLDTDDDKLKAASFTMLQQIEQQMDRAEKKRLLYVAATRARDHLIISGAPGAGNAKADHWLGRVLSSLDVDDQSRPAAVAYPGGEVAIHWHDAEAMPFAHPAAVPGASPSSPRPAAAHHDDDEPPPSNHPSDLNRFPLIGPAR